MTHGIHYKPNRLMRVIVYEVFGFSFIILFIWLDEVLDIPHNVFGGDETPINYLESVIESMMVLLISILCIGVTIRLLSKVKILEGLLPICASCKKIRGADNQWHQIEAYIEKRSPVSFSHGLCKECMDQLYGDQDWYIKQNG